MARDGLTERIKTRPGRRAHCYIGRLQSKGNTLGWSCSWIAVRGGDPDSVLSELALVRTGEFWEMPEEDWSCASLPNGWFVVFSARHCEPSRFNAASLARLSAQCELVASAVEEHVMFSSASYWKDGKNLWSVVHDAQRSIYHIAAKGELPTSFASIEGNARASQDAEGGTEADVDRMFDVPLNVGAELTGFRHDQDISDPVESPFEILHTPDSQKAAGPATKKPWWKVW